MNDAEWVRQRREEEEEEDGVSASRCVLNPEQWLATLAIKIQGKDTAACFGPETGPFIIPTAIK